MPASTFRSITHLQAGLILRNVNLSHKPCTKHRPMAR